MRTFLLALCLVTLSQQSINAEETSAAQLITDIYKSCISQYSTSCIKPKALAWISHAVNQDKIKITEELSIVRNGEEEFNTEARSSNPVVNLFDKLDSFLSSRSLKVEVPEILKTEEARANIPRSLLSGGLAEGLEVPLVEGKVAEGKKKIQKNFLTNFSSLSFLSFLLLRTFICKESHDSLPPRIEVQDHSSRSNHLGIDCFENMESYDPWTPLSRYDCSYGNFQIRQAKDRQL